MFVVIKMSVASVDWKKCVSQRPPSAVERVTITVTPRLEPDLDVNTAAITNFKLQTRVFRPDLKRIMCYMFVT